MEIIEMPVCEHVRPIKFGCPECDSGIDDAPEYRRSPTSIYANKLDLYVLQEEAKKRDDIINTLLHQVHDLTTLVHNINQWIAAKERLNADTR